MLQYKIPQNVGIEDKIVGPFSLRQLIILAVGGGISYVLFAITSRIYELNVLEYILIALPALFALAAAMLKIHNVTFIKYLALLLEFAIKPKKRMWDHRGISALVAPDLTDKTPAKKDATAADQAEQDRRNVNLRDLSVTLDSGGFEHIEKVAHEDIDEVQDDDLITEAYFGHKKEQSDTENMYWRTRDMQKKKLDLLAKMKQAAAGKQPAAVPVATSPMSEAAPAMPQAPVSSAPTPQQVPATTNAAGKKEGSVADHLASVIKEARQNNQQKQTKQSAPAAPVQATKPAPTGEIPAAPATPDETNPQAAQAPAAPKKKRKRKRKKKPNTGAVRPKEPVNTHIKPNQPRPKVKPKQDEGETSFHDLSGGDEIEINLD